ncbi:hypothetical protein VCHA47P369_50165 [Vibrio chagasii]|nr:hypothetical protein VCHA48P435_30218 [Vibrio chagasii]CAH7244786.1 hypothetical protein VCHA47P369_50165 [Vibrio chagasii]
MPCSVLVVQWSRETVILHILLTLTTPIPKLLFLRSSQDEFHDRSISNSDIGNENKSYHESLLTQINGIWWVFIGLHTSTKLHF